MKNGQKCSTFLNIMHLKMDLVFGMSGLCVCKEEINKQS